MKKAITIGLDAKGGTKILASPEVPFHKQRKAFAASKLRALPKGLTAVELYVRQGVTTGIDKAAQAKRLMEEGESIPTPLPETGAAPAQQAGVATSAEPTPLGDKAAAASLPPPSQAEAITEPVRGQEGPADAAPIQKEVTA